MGLRKTLRRYLSPRAYLRGLVNRRSGMRVLSGPFTGMEYVSESSGSAYLPKVVGCYERELNGAIDRVIGGDHDLLVDVGSAEGYYAVGLATRCDADVIAYEMNPEARRLAAALADKNGVAGRIDQREACDAAGLEHALAGARTPFVLVDVEGAEAEILDPEAAPSLARATVLVEIHEFARPGITAELMRRFAPTHRIETIWETDRSADEYPYASFWTAIMPTAYLRRAVEEHRVYKQSWLWLVPNDAGAAKAAA